MALFVYHLNSFICKSACSRHTYEHTVNIRYMFKSEASFTLPINHNNALLCFVGNLFSEQKTFYGYNDEQKDHLLSNDQTDHNFKSKNGDLNERNQSISSRNENNFFVVHF